LSKCGVCGAGFIMTGRNSLACFGAREKSTCENRLTIRRDEVEARVLKALQQKLLRQDLFNESANSHARDEPLTNGAPGQSVNCGALDRLHRRAPEEADRDGDGGRGAVGG
jgi:hypothetical protein